MTNRWRGVLLGVLVVAAATVTGCNEGTEDAAPYGALARQAEAVVLAEATGEVEGFPAEDPPRSLWTLIVRAAPKGDAGEVIRVRLAGEPVEKADSFAEGYPPFEPGGIYVLFLDRDRELWTILAPGYLDVDRQRNTATRRPPSTEYPRTVGLDDLTKAVAES